ncbi:MAG: flagellar basal body-associated FliL family protein [Verrucomicrobiota bacterium]
MADEAKPADAKPKPEEAKKPEAGGEKDAKAGAAPAATGGMSPMIFWGALGGASLLMLGVVVAIVVFVLPSLVAKSANASHGETTEEEALAEGESTKAETPKQEKKTAEGKKEEKKEASKKEEAKAGEKKEEKKEAHGEKGKEGEGAAEEADVKEFILQDVLVNVAGTRGARYVKASIFFDADPAVRKELESQRPKVIDLISQVLSSKSIDQLTADDSRGVLRSELLQVVNSILADDKVKNIYFLDFIIQ